MKFTFKDITNTEIYETAKILFVTGPYNIFNNIAIDEMRDRCKPADVAPMSSSLMEDFGETDEPEGGIITVSNTLDMESFMRVINIASMSGRWFTNVNYAFMTKKQKDWLNKYMKEPSDNGRLVIYCNEYKDYKALLKNKIIINSTSIHLIQLSFPSRDTLHNVVRALFEARDLYIEQKAIELFVMRMSSSYDDYEETINKIIVESVPSMTGEEDPNWKYTITYDDALSAMKGIENFVLDDFIERLLIPLKNDKPTGKNKIYRMLAALMEEMGPVQLVNKLKYKVEDYIEFRLAINSGIIPIQVKFSIPEAKSRLPEESRLTKLSDYTFRKMANIAGQTSLTDWTYMKLILNSPKFKYDPTSYEKVLYSLINRSVLNESRLNNDIGISNILGLQISEINDIRYLEGDLMFAKEYEVQ